MTKTHLLKSGGTKIGNWSVCGRWIPADSEMDNAAKHFDEITCFDCLVKIAQRCLTKLAELG